jgi:hypothetical protein
MTPTGGCGCTPAPFDAGVVGFVQTSVGAPADAVVTAAVRDKLCKSPAAAVEIFPDTGARTTSLGRYHVELIAWRPDTICARLVARSGADSSVRDSLVVALTRGFDTVRIDLALP